VALKITNLITVCFAFNKSLGLIYFRYADLKLTIIQFFATVHGVSCGGTTGCKITNIYHTSFGIYKER
jgi:hypothetical protein